MFRLLIKAGVEVDGKSKLGSTPLVVLAGGSQGQRQSAKLREASLTKDQRLHERLRPFPAEQDYIACIKVLLEQGADPNLPDDSPINPVNVAVMAGNIRILQTLIDGGAKLTPPPGECSPLHLAALSGNVECARTLLKAGASPNRPVFNGMTPREATVHAKVNQKEITELFNNHSNR